MQHALQPGCVTNPHSTHIHIPAGRRGLHRRQPVLLLPLPMRQMEEGPEAGVVMGMGVGAGLVPGVGMKPLCEGGRLQCGVRQCWGPLQSPPYSGN
jgi:hypothetical protein